MNEILGDAGGRGRPNRAISQQVTAAGSATSGHRNRVEGHSRGIKGEERMPRGDEKGGSGATLGPTDVRKQAVAPKADSQEGRGSRSGGGGRHKHVCCPLAQVPAETEVGA